MSRLIEEDWEKLSALQQMEMAERDYYLQMEYQQWEEEQQKRMKQKPAKIIYNERINKSKSFRRVSKKVLFLRSHLFIELTKR